MSKYIDAEKLYKKVGELMAHYAQSEEDMDEEGYTDCATYYQGKRKTCSEVLDIINSLQQEQLEKEGEENGLLAVYEGSRRWKFVQQEQPEVDFRELENAAELIANGIMIGVQANKYHTCIYDKSSNDFNHSHLVRAALKGIEFGLNVRKEE